MRRAWQGVNVSSEKMFGGNKTDLRESKNSRNGNERQAQCEQDVNGAAQAWTLKVSHQPHLDEALRYSFELARGVRRWVAQLHFIEWVDAVLAFRQRVVYFTVLVGDPVHSAQAMNVLSLRIGLLVRGAVAFDIWGAEVAVEQGGYSQ